MSIKYDGAVFDTVEEMVAYKKAMKDKHEHVNEVDEVTQERKDSYDRFVCDAEKAMAVMTEQDIKDRITKIEEDVDVSVGSEVSENIDTDDRVVEFVKNEKDVVKVKDDLDDKVFTTGYWSLKDDYLLIEMYNEVPMGTRGISTNSLKPMSRILNRTPQAIKARVCVYNLYGLRKYSPTGKYDVAAVKRLAKSRNKNFGMKGKRMRVSKVKFKRRVPFYDKDNPYELEVSENDSKMFNQAHNLHVKEGLSVCTALREVYGYSPSSFLVKKFKKFCVDNDLYYEMVPEEDLHVIAQLELLKKHGIENRKKEDAVKKIVKEMPNEFPRHRKGKRTSRDLEKAFNKAHEIHVKEGITVSGALNVVFGYKPGGLYLKMFKEHCHKFGLPFHIKKMNWKNKKLRKLNYEDEDKDVDKDKDNVKSKSESESENDVKVVNKDYMKKKKKKGKRDYKYRSDDDWAELYKKAYNIYQIKGVAMSSALKKVLGYNPAGKYLKAFKKYCDDNNMPYEMKHHNVVNDDWKKMADNEVHSLSEKESRKKYMIRQEPASPHVKKKERSFMKFLKGKVAKPQKTEYSSVTKNVKMVFPHVPGINKEDNKVLEGMVEYMVSVNSTLSKSDFDMIIRTEGDKVVRYWTKDKWIQFCNEFIALSDDIARYFNTMNKFTLFVDGDTVILRYGNT